MAPVTSQHISRRWLLIADLHLSPHVCQSTRHMTNSSQLVTRSSRHIV